MHTRASKPWQNADGVQRFLTPLRMHRVVGQLLGTGHMQPLPLTGDVQAGLILMQDLHVGQRLFDLLFHRLQGRGTALDQTRQRGLRERGSQQVGEDFTRSLPGQELLLYQVDSDGSQTRTILDGGRHFWREGGHRDLLACWTLFLLGLMFGHPQPWRRDIDHLAAFHLQCRNGLQILLTASTVRHRMHHNFIRASLPVQRGPLVSGLTSGFLAALLAQTFGLAHEAVGGGRQVAVVAVFVHALLQRLHLLLQLRDQQGLVAYHLAQWQQFGNQRFECTVFFLQSRDFFWCHGFTVVDSLAFCKGLGLLSSYKCASYTYTY